MDWKYFLTYIYVHSTECHNFRLNPTESLLQSFNVTYKNHMINIYLGLDFKIARILEPTVTMGQDIIYLHGSLR
jgi:hypothetical protein